MENETPLVSLSQLLASALKSEHNAVVARVTAADNSELVFVLQVIEITVGGITESLIDEPIPPKEQLN